MAKKNLENTVAQSKDAWQTYLKTLKPLFLQIVNNVTSHNRYFVQKKNAIGQLGLRPIQKFCTAIHMLADKGAADPNDEYLHAAYLKEPLSRVYPGLAPQSSRFMAKNTFERQLLTM
ncbi:hypothetical protein PSTG_02067 [Puccinia striiformis f. sp. tritici PST-78]|uniref:Uncharacterized protein n=1 Tax=Puccinia striiformis f. sp. tritici PST-78 TaxID=1165861 RepID=A0A0L0W0H2_9BASI|nr:hypothetical protein PSTG_02066 [Puccinia striiformis f. sp. tritici PST-78]KNF05011.1 hypothetical protein PSTG_02067 [Puccinia striiformis f. sp. tritici PST-78]